MKAKSGKRYVVSWLILDGVFLHSRNVATSDNLAYITKRCAELAQEHYEWRDDPLTAFPVIYRVVQVNPRTVDGILMILCVTQNGVQELPIKHMEWNGT